MKNIILTIMTMLIVSCNTASATEFSVPPVENEVSGMVETFGDLDGDTEDKPCEVSGFTMCAYRYKVFVNSTTGVITCSVQMTGMSSNGYSNLSTHREYKCSIPTGNNKLDSLITISTDITKQTAIKEAFDSSFLDY